MVPPLALPDVRRLPSIARLTQYEVVRLLIKRAKDVRSDFAITAENAPAIAEICTRLDGLPLAIDLAAARGVSTRRRAARLFECLGGPLEPGLVRYC